MAKFTKEDITTLYREQAAKHGADGTSTIQDQRTRELELAALLKYMRGGQRLLEVGCGNGYVAEQICGRIDVDIEAFDFSQDLIAIAQQRSLNGLPGAARFAHGDVLTYQPNGPFDLVFSERCIQNLPTWDEQKIALANIAGWLKPGGDYVMLESFWTGLNNLNEARAELDLEPIPESWHNRFFIESDVIEANAALGMELIASDCFLSGYYFGSRVLLPALLKDPSKASSKSRLNDFFCAMPPAGDFCPMKILHFSKTGK